MAICARVLIGSPSLVLVEQRKEDRRHTAEVFAAAENNLVDVPRIIDPSVNCEILCHVWHQALGFSVVVSVLVKLVLGSIFYQP